MGWFDEQIKARKKSDDETFEDSFIKIAGSVMGRKLSAAIDDERERTTDAVKEILHYYDGADMDAAKSIDRFKRDIGLD